ncbi:hypothetical protein LOY67_14230 [Pseudomonas sp. B21-056]|uniref:hypothetical protein n=1 Tax=Pseudomonas sp. B21-056 TaxID=2895495 RepID=UPI002231F214|nr:hypothetical protein [Pseudomonas sp. B21-056]UZE21210.1 hypothetical protein LOY67_14230 [Pseudomonas sp. B21-056]
MAQYMFPERLDPSRSVQGASDVNGGKSFYRLSEEQRGISGQLKFGKFFISRTHCLWDVVGNLLGPIMMGVRLNELAAFRLCRKVWLSTPYVCIK